MSTEDNSDNVSIEERNQREQIALWFATALENAFQKTGINARDFSWFSNRELTK